MTRLSRAHVRAADRPCLPPAVQLNSTLKTAFFPKDNPNAQALTYWGVYAATFVVRPVSALIFGHSGGTLGRNRTLTISIICMSIPTVVIG